MFTGIIETVGVLQEIKRSSRAARLRIEAPDILQDVRQGDSISTNGVCLTVEAHNEKFFEADVMGETLRRTNLGELRSGSPVNLELAMPADGRFGGHMVSGHIDGTGQIREMKREDNAIWVGVSCSQELMHYIIHKGSVALDGTSLTVAETGENGFQVSVIPHTSEKTILTGKNVGDLVNIEVDLVGKYVEKLLQRNNGNRSSITEHFLGEHGFL